MDKVDIKKIKKDYCSDVLTITEICEKYKITKNQLAYMRKKQKWKTRKQKGNKGNKGNKKAHGTKGNQNAVVTGAYAKLRQGSFSEEELALFNEPLPDKKASLEDEIRTLTIRENRMLVRINKLNAGNDLTITSMTKYGTMVTTQAESSQELINRLEAALTKVQEAKRRAIEALHKIDITEKGDIAENDSLADIIQEAYKKREENKNA